MIKHLITSIRALVVFTVITGVVYPLIVTAIGLMAFPRQAAGSFVEVNGQPAGSVLLAQKFREPRYFWPRPSAADYGTVASGASNQGYTSRKLLDAVRERQQAIGDKAPSDLLYASGSGLDPHISPEAAEYQMARVAAARGWTADKVAALVVQFTEPPQLAFLGQSRVNVLLLNIALDEAK